MYKQLDELLASHIRANMSRDAVRSWAYGSQGRNTWLTHAVRNADVELVALLMYYGADPLQRCYARSGLSALDDAVDQIEKAKNTQRAYLVITLLHSAAIPSLGGVFSHADNDNLTGADFDGFLGPDSYETPLTFAVRRKWLYAVRQLIERCGAKAHIKNGIGLTPIDIHMNVYHPDAPHGWQPMMHTLTSGMDGNAFLQGRAAAPT
jgi:hypothetical protein